MPLQFVVWNEAGIPLGEYETRNDAEEKAAREREECAKLCEADDSGCGVLHPHGIFIQIFEDGQDVTENDYGQYH